MLENDGSYCGGVRLSSLFRLGQFSIMVLYHNHDLVTWSILVRGSNVCKPTYFNKPSWMKKSSWMNKHPGMNKPSGMNRPSGLNNFRRSYHILCVWFPAHWRHSRTVAYNPRTMWDQYSSYRVESYIWCSLGSRSERNRHRGEESRGVGRQVRFAVILHLKDKS